MNIFSFLNAICYSSICPANVHASRWRAMVAQYHRTIGQSLDMRPICIPNDEIDNVRRSRSQVKRMCIQRG